MGRLLPRDRLARGVLAGLAAVALAGAAVVEGGDPAPKPQPLSSLLSGVYAEADLVASASVRVLVAGGGGAPTLARARIERTFKAPAAGGSDGVEAEITLFAFGPRETADPRNPSAPWFEGAAASGGTGRYVLFLSRSEKGSGWNVLAFFPAEKEQDREKEAVLAKEVELSRIEDRAERCRKTVDYELSLLDAVWPWTRLHGARELAWIATRAPEAIDEERRRRILAARDRAPESGVRKWLAGAFPGGNVPAPADDPFADPRPVNAGSRGSPPADGSRAGSSPSADPEWEAEVAALRKRVIEAATPEARVEALAAYGRAAGPDGAKDLLVFFEDPESCVREKAAVLLSDVGARDALPRLLSAFDAEPAREVRAAILRAAGILGDDATVPWVLSHGTDPVLAEARLTALARLRTADALKALDAARASAARAVPPDEATLRLVDRLRSPEFVTAERAAGRPVGPRPRAGGVPVPPKGPAEDSGRPEAK